MQMALGDALAVALLTRRGFTAAEFRQIHPGGRLGARLKRVRELMHAGDAMPLAGPDTAMDRALLTMTEKRFGCLGVVDAAGKLVGIVTDGDLRRHMGPDLLGRRTGEIMTHAPRTIGPEALAAEALHAMNARGRPITILFVVDAAGVPVGVLHLHDLLRAGVA
jgi:arabinose-5-phosphate isomerase